MQLITIYKKKSIGWQDGNFLEHEMLQQGLMWAIGRLAQCRKEHLLTRGVEHDLLPYLESADATVCGLAARAIGLLRTASTQQTVAQLQELTTDQRTLHLYDQGLVHTVSVADLATQALQELQELG